MSSTPIDQVVEERREELEVVLQDSLADGVVTPVEAGRIAVAMVGLREVLAEISASVRITRTILHAGASSPWAIRKVNEHQRDMDGISLAHETSPDPRQRIKALIHP